MSQRWNKTVRVKKSDVERAVFWFEFKLWLKVTGIVLLPTAALIWALLWWLDQMR